MLSYYKLDNFFLIRDDVVKVLNEAIDNREEGVVLKDPDSVYRPASRKAGWIKVKPEVSNVSMNEFIVTIALTDDQHLNDGLIFLPPY